MDILKYFNENASAEDWELVQKLYTRELSYLLKELNMQGKDTFNLAEVAVIYTRCALEKDLAHVETADQEIGRATNESTKEMLIEIIKEVLEDIEEEENNG